MPVDEIAALPVEALAAKDCVLFLWGVWVQLPGVLRVIESWGFTHKTVGFVWAKLNSSGEGWHTGQGHYTLSNTEFCLLATRGNPPTRLALDVHQLIVAPVREHSRKPDEVHTRIERLFAGPYLELFARAERPGWVTWGNEIKPPQIATIALTGRMKWLTMELMAAEHSGAELEPDDDPDFDTQLLTVDGLTLSLSAWARDTNIHPAVLRARIKSGWHADWILMPLPGMSFWEGNKPGLPGSSLAAT
jgi:N6-adenosine-specific RNA methylase IME4